MPRDRYALEASIVQCNVWSGSRSGCFLGRFLPKLGGACAAFFFPKTVLLRSQISSAISVFIVILFRSLLGLEDEIAV
jgi:hypothetical protein